MHAALERVKPYQPLQRETPHTHPTRTSHKHPHKHPPVFLTNLLTNLLAHPSYTAVVTLVAGPRVAQARHALTPELAQRD